MTNFKMLGVTDEHTTCDCCGKKNLKRTIVLQSETGIVYYGSDCAAKAMQTRKSIVDGQADVIEYAQKWLPIRDIKAVASAVWNKYGFLTEVKGNTIVIHGIGVVTK